MDRGSETGQEPAAVDDNKFYLVLVSSDLDEDNTAKVYKADTMDDFVTLIRHKVFEPTDMDYDEAFAFFGQRVEISHTRACEIRVGGEVKTITAPENPILQGRPEEEQAES